MEAFWTSGIFPWFVGYLVIRIGIQHNSIVREIYTDCHFVCRRNLKVLILNWWFILLIWMYEGVLLYLRTASPNDLVIFSLSISYILTRILKEMHLNICTRHHIYFTAQVACIPSKKQPVFGLWCIMLLIKP